VTRQEAVTILEEHFKELNRRFGVRRLALFGSVARDEATLASDVDILVGFGKAPTYRQYIGATLYLEDVFGHKVDLVTEGALKPRVASYVERDRYEVVDGA
jgi:predicted nucleotidyltransferase